jgi:hypothetical protein
MARCGFPLEPPRLRRLPEVQALEEVAVVAERHPEAVRELVDAVAVELEEVLLELPVEVGRMAPRPQCRLSRLRTDSIPPELPLLWPGANSTSMQKRAKVCRRGPLPYTTNFASWMDQRQRMVSVIAPQ